MIRRGVSPGAIGAFLVRNWPLKLAAVVVATLLYAGLVVSQDSAVYAGPITVVPVRQPTGTVLINALREIDQVRYIAPADAGRLRAEDFRATVDLSGVAPTGNPATVRVDVSPVDPRVTILEVRPRTIQVVLDRTASKDVEVRVDRGTPPAGLEVGETKVEPATARVVGPTSAIRQVVAVRASVTFDPGGTDVDNEVEPDPIDARGEVVPGVDVEPATVHVTIPVFTNRETRTVPVNPVLTGTPAPGFRIAAVTVDPPAVSVEGDQDQLAALSWADTQPVRVFGATSDVTASVELALPTGVVPGRPRAVTVTVGVVPVTETRTYSAGLRLDGTDPALSYTASQDRILLTLYGPVADLDRLSAAPLVVALDVTRLGAGAHEVPVVPSVPSGVTVARLSPSAVRVTITAPPSASPSSAASGAPASPSAAPGAVTPAPSPSSP